MKVIILGGSGELGTMLSRAFHGAWSVELDGADVVINLAGRSVNC